MPKSEGIQTDNKRYKIRRSIVIGLGGTGRNVCTHLKRILLEQSDNDPARFSHVRLLSIDTDARVKQLLTKRGESVRLESHELLGVRIPPALDRQLLHRVMNEQLMSFLSQANERGAMRSRPIGNAFLLVNWSAIRSRIKDIIFDLARADLRARVRTDPRYRDLDLDTNKLDIYVVGNLVSGTGSGMAVGLGYLVRDLTAELNDGNTEFHSEGVFTVCGIYALDDYGGQPSPYAVNCYSALLELNHFSNRDVFMSTGEGFDPGFGRIKLSEEARQKAPYDSVQLLNPSHSAAGELTHEELEPHIAQVLALRIGSAVGMIATAKIVDEMPNRAHYDDKGNLRFCWAWGANTFRSAGQEVLDLATTMAADQTLDVMTGEHVRTAINLKDEAWSVVRSVGFGYAEDNSQASLLKSLLTTQESFDKLPAGVSLVEGIERMITRAFPQPPENDRQLIKELPTQIDLKKGELSLKIGGLIASVVSGNRRRLTQGIRDSLEAAILSLSDYSEDGKGSLDDAIGVIDLLVGSSHEQSALLKKDGDAYQSAVQLAVSEGQRGRREMEMSTDSIRTIVSARGKFQHQALIGAWDQFVKGFLLDKISEARQVALEEARKILDGDGTDKNDTLRLGLIRHLEALRTRLRSAREQIQRLDSRFEARIEALEQSLRRRGQDRRRIEEARELKSKVLEGEQLRICARKVVEQILGPPHAVGSRYDDPDQLDKDYAKVDEILRERVKEIGSNLLAASIEDAPDFDGHLPTFLELSVPSIRLNPNHDQPPEVAYLSVPQNVPNFRAEVKKTGWLDARDIFNKQEDELFQERLDDIEPRVDVLVGRLTFSPASVMGIDRWATLYDRATVSPDGRRIVHTVPDSENGKNLVFEELGQTGTRVTISYLLARSLLWLREAEDGVFYEYPRGKITLRRDNDRKRLGASFSDRGLIQEFKTSLKVGVRDQELSNPVFVHVYRRFRQAMGRGADARIRDQLFSRLVIGVAQVAAGEGELGSDPNLPSPRRGDDFRVFENGLHSALGPLGLADDLFQRVHGLESVPPLGHIEALKPKEEMKAPFVAPPTPVAGASYQATLVSQGSLPTALEKHCPNGHPTSAEARFCAECGEKVVEPEPPVLRACTQCGEQIDPSARFCSQCGATVSTLKAEGVR